MKYTIITIVFLFWIKGICKGQCPDVIEYDNQLQVDQFPILYPNCVDFIGDFHITLTIQPNISEPIITNLNGFCNINSINGDLIFGGGPLNGEKLNNCVGFDNLTSIGGDFIIGSDDANPIVHSLVGLETLTTVGGNFKIMQKNCDGLEGLTSIGGNLRFADSWGHKTVDLNGLINLTSVGGLEVFQCTNLSTLNGLDNLASINGDVTIIGNDDLWNCSVSNTLCSAILNASGILDIEDNADGCNSVNGIISACPDDFYKFHHPVFMDYNENEVKDEDEPFYYHASINIEPGGSTSNTNQTNGGFIYLAAGNYTVELDQSSITNWAATGPSSFEISPPETDYFGIIPTTEISAADVYITSENTRCNELATFDVFALNNGTTVVDGTIWLEIDSNVVSHSFIDMPDSIISPYHFGWNFTDLHPSNTVGKQIELLIPGPEEFQLGEDLFFSSSLDYTDVNGMHQSNSSYQAIVLCSYDPNDKQSSPVYPENYALIAEELVYTIRFQNTGNAVANLVTIRDTLDSNLDLSTFRFIGTSHFSNLSRSIESDQFLTFKFENIMLPDSTSDFEGSQGFVMYSIKTFAGIDDFTEINNTAGIYFDANPPVITNTTQNTMVTSFDNDEDGSMIWEDSDDTDAIHPKIFPNPSAGLYTIQGVTSRHLSVIDYTGKIILKKTIARYDQVDLSEVPSGVYFLLLQTDEERWVEQVVKL